MQRLAAHNFLMPALSPTMTEGNIATWQVKEGDPFSAGDVLLEIETDKATMDVEAQEDGIMMKILSQDGSKSISVGTRIAVLAEAGDDIASLELPADSGINKQASTNRPGSEPVSSPQSEARPMTVPKTNAIPASGGSHELKYPLMPAVENLARQNGLGEDDLKKIRPTGPNGRLLKGDVLASLGTIDADTPTALSSFFEKLSHLDLSNIKVAKRPDPPAKAESMLPNEAVEVQALEVAVPISLSKVVEVQRRVEASLGVFLPLSTFINRAAEVANDDLPPASRQPTQSQLFDQVLGLDKAVPPKGTRGFYVPQISTFGSTSAGPRNKPTRGKRDIIDELVSTSRRTTRRGVIDTSPASSSEMNVFSLMVLKEEAGRARTFLERCKLILETEPGRLVL